jgi:hypothetical protein
MDWIEPRKGWAKKSETSNNKLETPRQKPTSNIQKFTGKSDLAVVEATSNR